MYITDLIPRTPFQWLYTCLLGYSIHQFKLIYFPNLTLEAVHECFINVDEANCGRPSRDWLIAPEQDSDSHLKLTKAEQRDILSHYSRLDEEITPADDCLIGAGYNNCRDLGFRAVKLFDALSPEIRTLQETLASDLQPKMHGAISDLETFIETFLFFFEQGSNAEFVSPDRDLFYLLHDRIYDTSQGSDTLVYEEIGGHASQFAIRSQIEQCRVYVTPSPTDFNIKNLRQENLDNSTRDLLLPID